jgi:hypothetical protein
LTQKIQDDINPPVFEQGPIRPPSEAYSLLVRVTRNCPWNQCEFCPVYKGQKFSRRSVAEVRADLAAMAWWREAAVAESWRLGFAGRLDESALPAIYQRNPDNPYLRSILLWLAGGGETAFLQDADNLILAAGDLVQMLESLRATFPAIKRVTTYSRSRTIAKRTAEELTTLRAAGLTRVHVGLESGSDAVLTEVKKGVTAEVHIAAGRAVKAAGLELSEYVMPGLGGRRRSAEHAQETARVLNAIDPDFIRLRSLGVGERMVLFERVKRGEFEVINDEEMVEELRLLISNLEGINSQVVSDHILNLLPEVEGKLPEDQGRMLAAIARFQGLPEDDRLSYVVGRRLGLFETLDDLHDPVQGPAARRAFERLKEQGDVHQVIRELASRFI